MTKKVKYFAIAVAGILILHQVYFTIFSTPELPCYQTQLKDLEGRPSYKCPGCPVGTTHIYGRGIVYPCRALVTITPYIGTFIVRRIKQEFRPGSEHRGVNADGTISVEAGY